MRATTTCLIMADHNRYSVDACAAGRMVLARSHAERIVMATKGRRWSPITHATSGARPDYLRSSALSAGSDEEAGCLAQRRALQRFCSAISADRRGLALNQRANTDPQRQSVKIRRKCVDHGLERR